MKFLTLCVAGALATTAAITHADESSSLGQWDLLDPAYEYSAEPLIDSHPSSRPYVSKYLSEKFDISLARLSNMNRVHADFETGKADLTDSDRKAIEKVLESADESTQIFIMGFASEQGDFDVNRSLAQRRAEQIKTVVSESDRRFVRVTTGYSAAALSQGGEGQRAEIWVFRSFQ